MATSAVRQEDGEKTREAVCAIGLQTRRGQLSDWRSETRVNGRLTFTTTSTTRLVQLFHDIHGLAAWWMVRRSPAACIVMKGRDGGCIDGY